MWRRKKKPMEPLSIEATAARILAERDLARRQAETGRVRALTDEWRNIRERNHLASAIEQSFRGGSA